MLLKSVVAEYSQRLLRYRYILMIIIGIIIILLIILIGVVYSINASNENNATTNQEDPIEEDDVMLIDINKKAKEQREQEILEETNAKGVIYLTFDDGPSSTTTPQILDILEQKHIKATFFVLHYNEKNDEIIKKEYDLGETIGLHGYTHTYSEVYQSADTCIENFKKIQEQVYQTTGYKSNIVRFPGGSSNIVSKKYCEGVMTELSSRIINEGFRYFDWNIDSNDAGNAKTSEEVYNNVVTGIKEKRNNVVLMHDFANNRCSCKYYRLRTSKRICI